MTSSLATSWLFKAESAGDVVNTWPEGVAILFGASDMLEMYSFLLQWHDIM